MMRIDIAVTTSGDIALSPEGDLLVIEDAVLADRQGVLITLLTNAPDFDVFPNFGANLEDLLGLDVTDPKTLTLADRLIRSAVPSVQEVQLVAHNQENALTILMTHPAFDRIVAVVFSLDAGIMVGSEAENLLYDAFTEF